MVVLTFSDRRHEFEKLAQAREFLSKELGFSCWLWKILKRYGYAVIATPGTDDTQEVRMEVTDE